MAAPKGNKFWLARSSHGRKPIFESPEHLWNAACEYFEWVEANPVPEEKLFHAQGVITKDVIYHPRPMTISAFRLFVDISEQTWLDYRKREDFMGICQEIDTIIYNQKFTGATAGLMNPSIIAREIGLKDSHEVNQTTHGTLDVNHSGTIAISKEEAKAISDALDDEC